MQILHRMAAGRPTAGDALLAAAALPGIGGVVALANLLAAVLTAVRRAPITVTVMARDLGVPGDLGRNRGATVDPEATLTLYLRDPSAGQAALAALGHAGAFAPITVGLALLCALLLGIRRRGVFAPSTVGLAWAVSVTAFSGYAVEVLQVQSASWLASTVVPASSLPERAHPTGLIIGVLVAAVTVVLSRGRHSRPSTE